MLDTSPSAAAAIVGDRMPARVSRAYRRYRHAPGAFKVDYAVEGGVPWTHEPSRLAGTVHLGGTFEEIAAAELAVSRGRCPSARSCSSASSTSPTPPDPGRRAPAVCLCARAVGFTGDATEAITSQIERFAPGFRDRIRATHVRTTADLEPATPTSSAVTSSRAPTRRGSWCSDHARPCTRTRPVSRASTCAPPQPRRAPEPTACAATTRPATPSAAPDLCCFAQSACLDEPHRQPTVGVARLGAGLDPPLQHLDLRGVVTPSPVDHRGPVGVHRGRYALRCPGLAFGGGHALHQQLETGLVHASRAQPVQGRHPLTVVATPDPAVQLMQHGL